MNEPIHSSSSMSDSLVMLIVNLSILIGFVLYIIFLIRYIKNSDKPNAKNVLLLSFGLLLLSVYLISNTMGFIISAFLLYSIYRSLLKHPGKFVTKPILPVSVISLIIISVVYFSNTDFDSRSEQDDNDRAVLHCKWCKKIVVAKEIGGVKVWYKGDNGNCYIKEVYSGTYYDFCSDEHCQLFPSEIEPDSELKDMFKKDGSDIAQCPYKAQHHIIQYPYTCPGCSYVGKK